MSAKQIITIVIDDVIANTNDTMRLWANRCADWPAILGHFDGAQ
jgi:hypothetical protein